MENINIILPQMQALWQCFYEEENAEQKRLLAIELAQVFLEWEGGQKTAGFQNPRNALKRAGGWQKVAECVCAELPAIKSTIESKKEALKAKISELSIMAENLVSQLSLARSELGDLQQHVEHQQLELDLKNNDFKTITNEQLRVREQMSALHELSASIVELDRINKHLADINTMLENGEDPVGYLQALTEMKGVSDKLLNHYRAYHDDNSNIVMQLLKLDGVNSTLATVPNRLLALDSELKAIDRVLQQQVHSQEKLDNEPLMRE